jgi:uncharacterized protein
MIDHEVFVLISRRIFLKSMAASGAVAATAGLYAWAIEPRWLEVVRRPLPIRDLPRGLDGRTLVQISDVHVGEVGESFLIESFQEIAELEPDIVVMTGDFMSYHARIFDEQLARVYRHFPKGRLATLAVLGNHDYGPRWAHAEVAQRVVDTVAPFGITVLRNSMSDVEGLQIGGLDDMWGQALDGDALFSRIDRARPSLVLSHNPDTVDLPIWRDYRGWILSGHTHGGQCRPPFLPPPILPVRNHRYTAGEFALAGDRRLYINRGIGYIVPVRFNVRPEVTVFELQRAA